MISSFKFWLTQSLSYCPVFWDHRRVRIDPNLRDEFERKFADVSVKAVESSRGFITVAIGKPTKWAPHEYVMISQWENEAAIKNFAGEEWNQAYIPRHGKVRTRVLGPPLCIFRPCIT